MKIVRRIFLFLSFLLSFQVESSEARKKINCDGDYFRCSIPFPGLGNVKLCKLWSTQSVPSHFTLIRIKANASSTFSSPSLPSARVALPCKAQSSTKTDDSNFHGFIFPSSSFFFIVNCSLHLWAQCIPLNYIVLNTLCHPSEDLSTWSVNLTHFYLL